MPPAARCAGEGHIACYLSAAMGQRFLICAAASLTMPALVLAQTPVLPQIEQARQFSPRPDTIDLQGQRNAPQSSALGGLGTTDDAFGTQVFLKRQERAQPFTAFAEIGAFVTNNVALVKKDPQDDRFLVGTAGAAFSQRFAYNLRVDASARASAYRYDKISELDFQSVDLSAGIAWSPPTLRGAEVLVRYTFTDLTTAKDTREFYQNHAVLLGVQKVVPFSRAQAAYFGASAQWSFADPAPAGRDEYSVYAGYRAQLTRSVDADLFYRYARYVYREGNGRRDDNQTVSLALHYTPTPWLSFSATGFYGVNHSNQPAFDYEVGNVGVGLQMSLRF
ncbi:MAG: hypothetical protein WCF18_22050 [Chthoniobacteraceae bacterium]